MDKWDKVVLKEWTSGTDWYRKKGWLPSWTHCADLQFEFRLICFYWWCPVTLVFSSFSPRQQAKMANYCRSIFGEMLLDAPLDSHPVTQFMLSWMASTILIMWSWRDKENSLHVCVCVGGGGCYRCLCVYVYVTGVCVWWMCGLQVAVCYAIWNQQESSLGHTVCFTHYFVLTVFTLVVLCCMSSLWPGCGCQTDHVSLSTIHRIVTCDRL